MIAALLLGALWCPQVTPDSELAPPVGPPRLETEPVSGVQYRAVTVEDCPSIGAVLGVRVGTWHDPADQCGLAAALAAYLRLHFEQPALASLDVSVSVAGPVTLLRATVPAARFGELIGQLGAVLGAPSVDEDLASRAIAKARLDSDDATAVLPGSMLSWRARRAMLAGDPRGRLAVGDASGLSSIDAEAIADRLRDQFVPAHAFLVTVGSIERAAVAESLADAIAPRDGGASPQIRGAEAVVGESVTEYRRVDAPYVSAAIPAKRWGDDEFLPFAVGMVALRGRAARVFQEYRRGEGRARFPFVDFNYFDEPGVVLVNRRGRDGDSYERVRDEVRGLLADVRQYGLALEEVRDAAAELQQAFAMPPFDPQLLDVMRARPLVLGVRAYVIALSIAFGWPEDLSRLVGATRVRDVVRVTRESLAAERIEWFAILPPGG